MEPFFREYFDDGEVVVHEGEAGIVFILLSVVPPMLRFLILMGKKWLHLK